MTGHILRSFRRYHKNLERERAQFKMLQRNLFFFCNSGATIVVQAVARKSALQQVHCVFCPNSNISAGMASQSKSLSTIVGRAYNLVSCWRTMEDARHARRSIRPHFQHLLEGCIRKLTGLALMANAGRSSTKQTIDLDRR